MEPIFFEPVFKDYIWGGNNLKTKLNKRSQYEKIAESWEISANKNGQSIIINNSEFEGKTLGELYESIENRQKIFGTKSLEIDEFPILIKFIDAARNLSIQVHPDDEFAKKYENSQGKAELWYIMDCKENAQIICGVKKTSKTVQEVFNGDNVEENLNYINVKKGDYIFIKPGTVHAILNGVLVCEIQQNSDVTYRIYDWNRVGNDGKPRELHKEKAFKVIDMNVNNELKHSNNDQCQPITHNDKFSTDLINVKDVFSDCTNSNSFFAYNVVEGNGTLEFKDKIYNLEIGNSFMIPATLGEYKIKGNIKLLKTYI